MNRFYFELFSVVFSWQLKYDKNTSTSYLRTVLIVSVLQLFNLITVLYLLSLKVEMFETINKNLALAVSAILVFMNYIMLLKQKARVQLKEESELKKSQIMITLVYIFLSIIIGAGILISKAG